MVAGDGAGPRSEGVSGRNGRKRREYLRSRLDPTIKLTPHAVRILELLSQGLTAPEIAAELGIACDTVHEDLAALRKRLGVKKSNGLPLQGVRHGFIAPAVSSLFLGLL